MASLTDLQGAAEELLTAFVGQLQTQGVDLPDRRYVAPGQLIPWDDEQLTVNIQRLIQGQPGVSFQGSFQPPAAATFSAQFAVSLCRRIPVIEQEAPFPMEVPTNDTLDVAGMETMTDCAALLIAAQAIHQAHTLTGPGEGFAIDECAPLGPEGGIAASRLLLTLSLT